jgi:hypothetical protein
MVASAALPIPQSKDFKMINSDEQLSQSFNPTSKALGQDFVISNVPLDSVQPLDPVLIYGSMPHIGSVDTPPPSNSYSALLVVGLVMGLFVIGSTVLAISHIKKTRKRLKNPRHSDHLPDLEPNFMGNAKTVISSPLQSYRQSNESVDELRKFCLKLDCYSDDIHGRNLHRFHSLKRDSSNSDWSIPDQSQYRVIRSLLSTLPDPDDSL